MRHEVFGVLGEVVGEAELLVWLKIELRKSAITTLSLIFLRYGFNFMPHDDLNIKSTN
jgi:hypothetical protein